MRGKLAAILLGLGLVGCGGALPSGMEDSSASSGKADQPKIIGGTNDTDDPNIIALFAQVPGATKGALCTAELISPTVLLTAAHCVAEEVVGQGSVWRAFLAPDFADRSNPANWVDVKEVHHDPAFNINNVQSGHDIGVAILAQPITTIQPKPFNRTPITQEIASGPVRIVGYGLSDGFQQTGAGVKRAATTKLAGFNDLLLQVGGGEQRICNGDSGGPTLAQIGGVETIIGVTSFGFIFCLGPGSETRVDQYTSFIDQYLN